MIDTKLLDIRVFLLKFEGMVLDDTECDAFALLHANYMFTIEA